MRMISKYALADWPSASRPPTPRFFQSNFSHDFVGFILCPRRNHHGFLGELDIPELQAPAAQRPLRLSPMLTESELRDQIHLAQTVVSRSVHCSNGAEGQFDDSKLEDSAVLFA